MGHGCCPAHTDPSKAMKLASAHTRLRTGTDCGLQQRPACFPQHPDTMTGNDDMDHQLQWGSDQTHATKDNSVIGSCPAGDSGVKGVCPLGILQVSPGMVTKASQGWFSGTACDLQFCSLRHEQCGPTCTRVFLTNSPSATEPSRI